jgi:hypothetical protein
MTTNQGHWDLTVREQADFRMALFCLACIVATLVFNSVVPLLPDVSYILVADGRFLQGDIPYTDLIEINPPLIFWITLPPVWLAGILGLSVQAFFVTYVCLFIVGSLYLTSRIVDHNRDIVPILAVVTTLGSAWAFGQREHFAMLLVLPYVASVAVGAKLRPGMGGLIGFLAGAGLDFKPYFLVIPVLVEVFVLATTCNWRALLRVETLAMAAVVLIYPVLVWWRYPQYFSEVIPLVRQTYVAYQIPLADIAQRPVVVSFGIFVAATVVMMLWQRRWSNLVWLVAAVGGLIAYLAQGKGWPYQLLPGMIFVGTAFLLEVLHVPVRPLRWLALGCFVIFSLLGAVDYALEQRARVAYFDGLLGSAKPQRMLVLTHDGGVVFPFLPDKGIGWGGHYLSLWMMPVVSRELVEPQQAAAITAATASVVAGDLATLHPDFVIVDRRSASPSLRGHEIKYVELFSATPAFAAIWQSYKLVNSKDNFELWQLQ